MFTGGLAGGTYFNYITIRSDIFVLQKCKDEKKKKKNKRSEK